MTDDHDIMLAVRDGEMEKLSILFHRYAKYLYNFFFTGIHDRDACEDLVQEVFLRILKYRHTFRENGNFMVWMFAIARNVRTDHYREMSIRHEPIENHEEIAGENPDEAEALDRSDEISLVRKALARLPEEMREMILLSKFREMRYKDIGSILNCSEGAVKVRVFRAMQELKAMYHTLRGDEIHDM